MRNGKIESYLAQGPPGWDLNLHSVLTPLTLLLWFYSIWDSTFPLEWVSFITQFLSTCYTSGIVQGTEDPEITKAQSLTLSPEGRWVRERNPGAKVQESRTTWGIVRLPVEPNWGCLQWLLRNLSWPTAHWSGLALSQKDITWATRHLRFSSSHIK